MSEHTEILDAALARLQAEYIFPDKAEEADAAIRRALAAGEYDGLDGPKFCEAVTATFFAACADKHLRLLWNDEPSDPDEDETDDMFAELSRSLNHGFARVERLEGNVGLLDLRLVPAPEDGAPLIAASMRLLAGTEALIMDLRKNRGGSPDTVALWCSYFFGEPVHLNDVYHRKDDLTRQYWTVPHVDGPRYLGKPIYVLTSSSTFSGGEELAYNLKVNGRATLVGETTRGGAHPTEWYPLTPHIAVTVPTSRSINPITGTNWEGVGIEPHIAVPADQAFDVAYQGALSTIGAAA